MKFLYPISLAMGLALASSSSAEQFVLDPLQSFIEVDLQSLVQGEPWGFIDPVSGELNMMGYGWHVETRSVRYTLSGHFDWHDTGLRQDRLAGIVLQDIELHADTPKPWQLELPTDLAFDALTDEISKRGVWTTLCPDGIQCSVSTSTWYTPYTTSLMGRREGAEIYISGTQSRMTVSYSGMVAGGISPPYEILLPVDPTMRYNIVATAVPEPAQYGLLLTSLPLVWWSVRRRRQSR